MKIDGQLELLRGEIWAVGADSAPALSAWCSALADAAGDRRDGECALVACAGQSAAPDGGRWPGMRYYVDGGETVDELLSYRSVYEINPFEVGARRRAESPRSYLVRKARLLRLTDLEGLRHSPVLALSNGETRRLQLACALAKGTDFIVLDDPAAGLDPARREQLKSIVDKLAQSGVGVIFAYRHPDEVPSGVSRYFRIDAQGRLREQPPRNAAAGESAPPAVPACVRTPSPQRGKSVVEIRHLDLKIGRRTLFRDFSWRVCEGERWILRGGNGSGKTTLFALITGDSPYAYAADIRVFSIPRAGGCELDRIRRRIGIASPELQACLNRRPEELVAAAIGRQPRLLLLDEPFVNMDARTERQSAMAITDYLRTHPRTAAILVCHRDGEAPCGFNRVMDLDDCRPSG